MLRPPTALPEASNAPRNSRFRRPRHCLREHGYKKGPLKAETYPLPAAPLTPLVSDAGAVFHAAGNAVNGLDIGKPPLEPSEASPTLPAASPTLPAASEPRSEPKNRLIES
ncbi:hypothetical protein L596_016090 [Steinernema carpocapsae]|uniref:Uncharacterized protein n=1 Tax=Steinernema carpocapsae TaxID=34508 RepID=A0A4U5NI59_STECR|nr:hypothetical protein L596_016090 [Steinernema carpocapsae]